ncbi:MAG: hypothetical protein WEC84_05120 [Candidatus Andersenbacteria bacterium]
MIAEILSTEGDPNEPVTRGEFNEAMQAVNTAFQKVATKDDLKALEQRFDGLEGRMNNGFQEIDKRFDELFDKIDRYIDVRVDNVTGINRDEVSLIKDKQQQHEKRISALEVR